MGMSEMYSGLATVVAAMRARLMTELIERYGSVPYRVSWMMVPAGQVLQALAWVVSW